MKTVVELGHIVAGPAAGLIFHDLGFRVIKVEPLDGEKGRRLPDTSVGVFPYFNRGKESIALDIRKEDGKEILFRILMKSDILIDNLSPGYLDSLGVTYEKIHSVKHDLVILSIKGYGPGKYEKKKSLDFPIEVQSGVAFMNGLTGRPMRFGSSIIDMNVAMFGVIRALYALIEENKGETDRIIRVGMFETAAFLMGQHIATYQLLGTPLKPFNEQGFAWSIYDFFTTLDKKEVFVAVTSDKQWKSLCEELELGVCNDEVYETNQSRYSMRDQLIPLIRNGISRLDYGELVKILEKHNISQATLNEPWSLVNDEHLSEKMVKAIFDDYELKVPATPETRFTEDFVPSLGLNTEGILREIGYSEDHIERLVKDRVVFQCQQKTKIERDPR